MLGKNIETLTNELVKVTKEKTLLLNEAIKLVTDAIEKHDEVTIARTTEGQLIVKGQFYGQAIVDLDEAFKSIKTTASAELIARELMGSIMKEMHGEPDHLL